MNISKVFSTEERVRILEYIIFSEDAISAVNVAKDLKLSKALISKFFDILAKEGILKRSKSKVLVLDNVYARAVKILLILNSFNPRLFEKYKFVKGVGLYGSCAKGKNVKGSDIDLWIKIKKAKEVELAKLTSELERRYEEIKPLFLTEEKVKVLKDKDPVFYHSLLFGSIIVYGEEIEI